MNTSNQNIRTHILQMIKQCSSFSNLEESNSVGYAGLNQDELKELLYETFHSHCGLDKVEFLSSTPISQVINIIIRKMPVGIINDRTYQISDETSCSYSQSCDFSEPASPFSTSTTDNNINMDKRQIEYIVGIDLGHGETSAAICPLQWDTPVEQLDPAKDLEMGGNKKVIPSAITVLDSGAAYIGDSAFNPEILKQANVNVCFKKAPKDINGKAEKLMIRYMQEVYRRIRENNSAMLTDNNHLIYIATPSGWDKTTQDLYLQMAKRAGLPIDGLTKESRAAFVRAHHDVTSGIGKSIEKGAVVFDMGSSTLDFTYMGSDGNIIDHGYDCGASFIEKTIFKECEDKYPVIHRFEDSYPRLVPFLLFEARKVKEQVYFDPSLKVKKTINFEDFIDDETFEDDRFKIMFQPGELNSRCWNIPESQIYKDQDPSFTISQGVAEVARMDLRTEGIDDGLEETIDRLQNSDIIYDSFIEKFAYALWDRITDEIGATATAFKDSEEDYSLYDLQTSITGNVQQGIKEVIPNIISFMQETILENTVAHY